jgi:hypothetical protein
MNKLKIIITNAALITITSVNALAKSTDISPFIDIDYTKPASFASNDNQAVDFSYAPKFSLGLSHNQNLSNDWAITNSLSISYMNTDADLTGVSLTSTDSSGIPQQHYKLKSQQIGFWANSRLKHINSFENLTPFVELSAGIIDADYRYNNNNVQQWQKNYKAIIGLEIATSTSATISIGAGYSTIGNDINLASLIE